MNDLYNVIFKRKTIRKFDENLVLTKEELEKVQMKLDNLIPLCQEIKVKMKIVKREETTAKRGEYCLLLYSENKPHYLLNAGYILEQMDLFLTSLDIGVCWYALAKTNTLELDGLDFIIMLAFGKSRLEDFRTQISQFRRKEKTEIWTGDFDNDVEEAVRLAPSSCNTQPWRVVYENKEMNVYRNKNIKSFIPPTKLPFYNSIDLGIFLCFLEISLNHKEYNFIRTIISEEVSQSDLIRIANYKII